MKQITRMGKWLLFGLAALCAALLCSCSSAKESFTLEITNEQGAGNLQVSVRFQRDDARQNPDNNEDYFPRGMEPLLDFFNEHVAEGFTVTYRRDHNEHYFEMGFSFDSTEDFWEKAEALVGAQRWEMAEMREPQVRALEGEQAGEMLLEYSIPYDFFHLCTSWAYEALVNDGEAAGVFDPWGTENRADLDSMYSGSQTVVTIRFLGQEAQFSQRDEMCAVTVATADDGRVKQQSALEDTIPGLTLIEPVGTALPEETEISIVAWIVTGCCGAAVVIALVVTLLVIQRRRRAATPPGPEDMPVLDGLDALPSERYAPPPTQEIEAFPAARPAQEPPAEALDDAADDAASFVPAETGGEPADAAADDTRAADPKRGGNAPAAPGEEPAPQPAASDEEAPGTDRKGDAHDA